MHRVRLGFALFSAGMVTAFAMVWLRTYLYPQVLTPSASAVARSFVKVARLAVEQYGPRYRSKSGLVLSPRVILCLDRGAAGGQSKREWETVKFLFYFRALSEWWDPRGAMLDATAGPSFLRRHQVAYGSEGGFHIADLKTALERELSSEWLDLNSLVTTGFPKVTFFEDCQLAPREEGLLRVALVAVSPEVVNPYGLAWYVESVVGFFAAFEVSEPAGTIDRLVVYNPTHVLKSNCPFRTGLLLPDMQLIPSRFWKEEFGSWIDLVSAYQQRRERPCPR